MSEGINNSPVAAPAEVSPSSVQTPIEQTQAQPSKTPEVFEVKVDGKVMKMTRDEMIQHASLGHAAQKRFQEAAQMKKQAESVLGRLRDPKQAISLLQDPSLGLNKEQVKEAFEQWYINEFIEPEKLSPVERRARDAEAKLQKYQEQEKQRESEKLKSQQEAMTSQARENLQSQIVEALDTSGLPKTNFTVRRLAYWMQRNLANGYDAPMDVIVGQVRNEVNSSLRDLVEASDGEVLIKILGDGVVGKLRKYDLEQLRKTRGSSTQPVQEVNNKQEKKLTSSEVDARLRQLQRTGKY